MSLLLGVLSSGQKGEEKPFREGIIQQPGSFYSDNSSSSIWGNTRTPSLWGDFQSPNVAPFSIPSVAPAFVFTSSSNSNSTRMDKDSRVWHDSEYSIRDQTKPMTGVSGYGPNNTAGQSVREQPTSHKFMSSSSSDSTNTGKSAGYVAHESPTVDEPKLTTRKSGFVSNNEAGPSTRSDLQSDSSGKFIFSSQPTKSVHAAASNSSCVSTKTSLEPESGSPSLDSHHWKDIHVTPDTGSMNVNKPKPAAFGDQSQVSSNTDHQFSSTRATPTPLEVKKQSFGREQPNPVPSDKKPENPGVFIFGASGSSIASPSSHQSHPGTQHRTFNSSYVAPGSRTRNSKFKRHSYAVKAKPAAPMGSQPVASEFKRETGAGSEVNTKAEWLRHSYAGDWQQHGINIECTSDSKNSPSEKFNLEDLSPGFEDSKHMKNVEGQFGSWYPFSDRVSSQASEGTEGHTESEPTLDKAQRFTEKMNPNDLRRSYSNMSGDTPVKDIPISQKPDILEKEVRGTTNPVLGTDPQEAQNFFTFGSSWASNSEFGNVNYGGSGMPSNITIESDDVKKHDFTWSDGLSSSNYGSKHSVSSGSSHVHFTAGMDQSFPSYLNQSVHKTSQSAYDFERHNEFPTGEFSGPVSSTDSSGSESSPARPERSKPATQKEYFEFQGSTSLPDIGHSSTRRQRRGVARTRKSKCNHGAQANSMSNDATMSPMDFSPAKEDAATIPVSSSFEKPSFDLGSLGDHWADLKTEDTVEWMRFAEKDSSEQLRAVDTRYQNNQAGTSLNNFTYQEPEKLNQGIDPLTINRTGNWKSTETEKGLPGYQFENEWSSQTAREVHRHIGSFIDESANSAPNFTFGASSTDMSGRFTNMDGDSLKHSASGVDSAGNINLTQTSAAHMNVTSQLYPNNNNVQEHASHLPEGNESPSSIRSAAAEQVCERWRLRGNQAYANGDFPKAEEYYSRGASSVSPSETSQSCIRASMLCYSNRAATRMAVGRMREALADCKRAMVVDPSFLRVRLRAASCHLALGETKSAAVMFKECIKFAKEGSQPDHKILAEAVDGAKKTQQVDDYSDRAMELLKKDNITDSTSALRIVNEALSISPYSESLHEIKAQVLLSLRRYDEVLQFCEQSLPNAGRNHSVALNEQQFQDGNPKELSPPKDGNLHLKLWRWRLCAKALYHLGRLDEALDLLKKHAEAVPMIQLDKTEPWAQLMANIQDMLRHKAAGNDAFQQGNHNEAVEHYSAALACNGESRPFNAVCFCNRAAASQALGHIADAIADCSRAIALDPSYAKAVSRRATLHALIRDYGQTCNDLRRLLTILESAQSKNSTTMKGASSSNIVKDLKQAQDRLQKAEEDLKKGLPIDHYLVLGVDSKYTASEIKKAYRKAALKFHPDKAGQVLTCAENGDDGSLWKEVRDEVRKDSERLFKLIGEAYAILSDQNKRLRYDSEEERRKNKSKDTNSQGSNDMSDLYNTHFGRSGRHQRERNEAWSSYAPNQRWQTGPDAAQPDTYAHRNMYSTSSSRFGNTSRNTEFSWDDI